jgi:hypothetical protein
MTESNGREGDEGQGKAAEVESELCNRMGRSKSKTVS